MLSALVALTVSLVSAQDFNTSDPFVLKVTGSTANVTGQYLGACHAGAAIEQLCLSGTDVLTDNYGTFTLNVSTRAGGDYETGPLVWELPLGSINVSEGLQLSQTLYSNLAIPLFEPSTSYDYVGFDEDDKLFIYSGIYDESTFVPGVYPTAVAQVPLYHVSPPLGLWTDRLADHVLHSGTRAIPTLLATTTMPLLGLPAAIPSTRPASRSM